jgi:indolepyruvate ferredoxin oxidoreductase alpha subunit
LAERKLLLGNEAIARGVIENGCAMATSYPGTPASEILAAVAQIKSALQIEMHTQWAINEKVALEIAYAGAQAGLRTAVAMKQVGLNVASDPLMSAAYMGTCGGFVVISADDPGPHSSQTEQDSRLMAMMAKIPVLDPNSPRQARDMLDQAFTLSEQFELPVMLRPTTRVCHARQDIELRAPVTLDRVAAFEKNPTRWAATPKFRQQLHRELEAKLASIARFEATAPQRLNTDGDAQRAVVVAGVASAHAQEILQTMGLWSELPLYQVLQPYPLHQQFIAHLRKTYAEVLVIEETVGVIEMQLADRDRVRGKLDGIVPAVGELTPEVIEQVLDRFNGRPPREVQAPTAPGRRPTLCAGCPHRASFFAIKKAARKAIYTSDIGCYTLGLNLGAVDTVLCMGAAISQAAGFYHAYKNQAKRPDIVATIGDSTFFHAGLPALVDAVTQGVRFVLVILDNRTTAMTGNQPTPATGLGAGGEALQAVDIEDAVRGCGIDYIREANPYHTDELIAVLKSAVAYSRETGPAVVISRYPCVLDKRQTAFRIEGGVPIITDDCDGCGYCVQHFECPAICLDDEQSQAVIDDVLCSGCGVCTYVCPKQSIQPGS